MELDGFVIKVFPATIAGLLIGLERELQGKHAGLKTNALVALGSCIFIVLSLEYEGEKYIDTTRVLSQVIIGIGFIGAGTIMKKGKDVEGLTTAATIWCSAGVGCLIGFAHIPEAAVITVLVIGLNFVFSIVERKLIEREKARKKAKEKLGKGDEEEDED